MFVCATCKPSRLSNSENTSFGPGSDVAPPELFLKTDGSHLLTGPFRLWDDEIESPDCKSDFQ